ncbi:MAG: HAD-IA family hydrolase [Alcanivoracaceae bacterium]|nr:HAD-IA family hydrolase [Alcanivoracaceae bacterium]
MKQLVIFDWDGTLMDSTGRIVECLCLAADDTGLPTLAADHARSIIGLGLPEAIRTLYPGIDSDDAEQMRQHYARHFIAAEEVPSRLFPGVRELLDELSDSGVTMAVATGKSRKGLDRVWRGSDLGGYFAASRCADESRSKPHPAMVNELLAQLGKAPHQALVVGDTSFDLQMASNAGVESVAMSWGAHPRELLAQYSPRMVLDDIRGILPLLKMSEMT